MTVDEARELAGRTVLWNVSGRSRVVQVAYATSAGTVCIQSPDGRPVPGMTGSFTYVNPGELSHRPPSTAAAAQAALNDLAGLVFYDERSLTNSQVELATGALRNLNWAAGFDFTGERPPSGEQPESYAEAAAALADRLWDKMDGDDITARRHATLIDTDLALRLQDARRALVYLVIHADLNAVKVGISEEDGTRIGQHRRRGWQLAAAFQVTGKAAVAIERDILRWWRVKLSLPVHLKQQDMPQGGYTETVAANRIDLAVTVARVCELALKPEARPHRA